ncbi:MAG: gamma-glutamyltransferase family protein [Halodesulfurarchaeum sp.]
MVEPDLGRFDSRRSTLYAPNGAVATSQPLAARAGVSVLRDGGNAFDAAVATAATLNVVEPTSTGLGGDVFALYRTADGEVGGMQSCGAAPTDATPEAIREAVAMERDTDPSTVSMPETGPHTVTVPGTARGWEATIQRFGTMSLSRVLEPAVSYATEGYPVTAVVSAQWQHGEELFEDENARAAYLTDGRAPSVGERMSLPALGRSLELVGERGADVVYEGEIGEAIVSAVRERGGLLSRSDLADHEVDWVEPVSTTYRGVEVFELPPPNQGLIALEALSIFEDLDVPDPFGSSAWTHRLIESTKTAFHDGHHYITDPAHEDVPPLTDPDYTRRRAADIGDRARQDVDVGLPGANGEEADTVLLTVGDEDGNLVSFINSRFAGFGSGIVAGETGIALQNRGSSFSLDSKDPNVIAPGKRPFHTLIPGLARFGPSDWAAFGVMGGYMQPQGHVQVLANLIDGDMPLQAALDRPRWRYLADGSLAVEERMDGGRPTKLARRGHEVRVLPPNRFGGAQIVREQDGVLSGATEPRKDGVAIGY